MASRLEENRNLMRKLCELPDKEEELLKSGLTKDDIETISQCFLSFNIETKEQLARIKDIISKVENGKTLFQGK